MDQLIKDLFDRSEFGVIETLEHVSILPIFAGIQPRIGYTTLEQAMATDNVQVTEFGDGGTVPEVELVNDSNMNLLLLDGEELDGAKQNRVLNTSLLVGARSRMTIPVTCTEQGRWSSTSRRFRSPKSVMPSRLRYSKKVSVDSSLRSNRVYRSDQHKVWSDVNYLLEDLDVTSNSRAMGDARLQRGRAVDDYTSHFQHLPSQVGMVVFIDGSPTGIELCSREDVFKEVMPKLIGSHVFESVVKKQRVSKNSVTPTVDLAKSFCEQLVACDVEQYDSLALGTDMRMEGNTVAGTALVHEDEVIQLSAYAVA